MEWPTSTGFVISAEVMKARMSSASVSRFTARLGSGFGAEPKPGRSTAYTVASVASTPASRSKYREETPIPCTRMIGGTLEAGSARP
jgi:hypothetical protein